MAGGATTNEEKEQGLPPPAVAGPSPSRTTARQQRLERRARLRGKEEDGKQEATTAAAAGDPRLRLRTSTAAAARSTSTAAVTRRLSRRSSAVTTRTGPVPAASMTLDAPTMDPPPLSLRKRGQKRRDAGDDNEDNREGAAPSTAAAGAIAALAALSSPRRRSSVKKTKATTAAPPPAGLLSSSSAVAHGETDEAIEPETLLRPNEEVDSSSSSGPRTRSGGYHLRATTVARSVRNTAPKTGTAATFITPGTPAEAPLARHLDFERHGEGVGVNAAASDGESPQVDDNVNADNDDALVLPPGVVNVFAHRSGSCQCPADRCYLTDTAVGFAHIAHYGDENGQILKRQEVQQLEALRSLLPPFARHPHSSQESSEESMWSGGTNPDAFPPDVHDAPHGFDGSGPVGSHPRSSGGAGGGGARQLNLEGSFGAGNGSGGCGVVPPAQWTRTSALLRQPYLSPRMRAILVHWLVEVGQEYKVSEPAFHLAVSMLDHLLLKGPTAEELAAHDDGTEHYGEDAEDRWFLITRSNFQAVGCACAWIAAKLEDRNAPSVEDYVWISDQSFQSNKLRSLEERVCRELSFRLNHVTPYHFVNLFLRASRACPSGSCQHDHPTLRPVVMYLLALARLSYQLSFCRPSLLAAAAVYLGRATVGIRDGSIDDNAYGRWWSPTLEYYTGYTVPMLRDAVLIVHRFQLGAERAEDIRGIHTKFSKPLHHGASIKTARRVEDLGLGTPHTHDTMDLGVVAMQPY